MRVRTGRRPGPHEALVELPELFARQNTDCSGGTNFYRCSINDFAGCCSVDPCAMEDGCPDEDEEDEDEEEEDEEEEDEEDETTTTSSTSEKTTTSTDDVITQETVTVTKTNDEGDLETSVITTDDGAVIPTGLRDLEGEDDDGGGGGLSGGAIAGIVVGVLAVFLIVAALLFWRRRRQKKLTPAEAVYPPPMDANDEKFLGSADPASATTPSASTTPASVFGKLGMSIGMGSRAPTPSTPGQTSVGGNATARHSYVSSMTSASPPPGPGQFTPAMGGAAQLDSNPGVPQLDSSPVTVAEMDGAGAQRARPPSELPATPVNPAAPGGLGVHHARERSGGALPTVAENEAPRATLNQTDGRTYVNSWSSYEAVQNPPVPRSLQVPQQPR